MTQALQSPLTAPVLQLVAAIAISQVLFRSPLTDFVGKKLTEITDEALAAVRNVVFDFPVIALSTGITYVAHELATRYAPFLSLSTQAAGSLKVAAFVGGVFALKSALSAYLERVTQNELGEDKDQNAHVRIIHREFNEQDANKDQDYHVRIIRRMVNDNLLPVAVGTAGAYYAGIPIKLTQSALYIAALIPVTKLLGSGFKQLDKVAIINTVASKIYNLFK